MKEKKPRQSRIGLDFDGPATVAGMRQNDDGSITFLGLDGKPLPIHAGFAGVAYDRPKGPKVTFQIPDQGEAIGALAGALARYTHIIGVDTNARDHHGEKVCVTAVCELKNLKFEGPRWSCNVDALWALEFREPQKLPEQIGWRHALAHGEELGWLNDGSTILLVVDAYLDDLHQINKRNIALIDDYALPKGVSIAYASSDSASDSPLNGLIARCDRLAREVLDHATAPSLFGLSPLISAEQTPFRAHRYWKFEST